MIDISVKDLVKSFDADTNLLDGVSFDIQAGERVGLLGRNGAGKTTLFKILTGELDYNTGEVRFAPGRKVGLISQIPHYPAGYTVEDVLRTAFRELTNIQGKMRRLEEQMAAHPDKAMLTEYDALSTRFQTGGGYETDMQTDKICNGLGIPAAQRQQDFDSLSGGEKTRVNLARLLLEKTDILLLDEPTNHLDMHAVEWLEGYIEKFKGTVLTISHDRYFLNRIPTRIVELTENGMDSYLGTYDYYVEKKQAQIQSGKKYMDELSSREKAQMDAPQSALQDSAKDTPEGMSSLSAAEQRKLKKEQEAKDRRIRRQKESLEADIASLENDISCLEAELCLEENMKDHVKLTALSEELADKKGELELKYEEWLILQE